MTSDPVIDPQNTTLPLRLLDVRDADSFAEGHALGAVRVPIEGWVSAARTQEAGWRIRPTGPLRSPLWVSVPTGLQVFMMTGG